MSTNGVVDANLRRLNAAVTELSDLARAFLATGNEKVADTLLFLAEDVQMSTRELEEHMKLVEDARFREAQNMVGSALKGLLGEKKKPL